MFVANTVVFGGKHSGNWEKKRDFFLEKVIDIWGQIQQYLVKDSGIYGKLNGI